jgi:hypothetical protein
MQFYFLHIIGVDLILQKRGSLGLTEVLNFCYWVWGFDLVCCSICVKKFKFLYLLDCLS